MGVVEKPQPLPLAQSNHLRIGLKFVSLMAEIYLGLRVLGLGFRGITQGIPLYYLGPWTLKDTKGRGLYSSWVYTRNLRLDT